MMWLLLFSLATDVDSELQATHSDIAKGKYRLLYSSPEALFASDQWTVGGTIHVMFATMALGMGVNFVGLYATIHYGAPQSLGDYFQESRRAGRDGRDCTSVIYWMPRDAPQFSAVPKDHQQRESLAVQRYVDNESTCRRYMLLQYFDEQLAKNVFRCRQRCCEQN